MDCFNVRHWNRRNFTLDFEKHPNVSVLLQFPLKNKFWHTLFEEPWPSLKQNFVCSHFRACQFFSKTKLMSTPWLLDVPLLNDTVNSFEFSDAFVQVTYDCYVVKTMPVRIAFEPAAEGRCLPVRCHAVLTDTARVFLRHDEASHKWSIRQLRLLCGKLYHIVKM
jgi:hypothetical protein